VCDVCVWCVCGVVWCMCGMCVCGVVCVWFVCMCMVWFVCVCVCVCVCGVCSYRHPACNEHAPCCGFFGFTVSHNWHDFQKKASEHEMHFLIVSTSFVKHFSFYEELSEM